MKQANSLKIASVAFAVLWTLGMMLWTNDYQPVPLIILALCGVCAGFGWYWLMSRFQRRLLARDR